MAPPQQKDMNSPGNMVLALASHGRRYHLRPRAAAAVAAAATTCGPDSEERVLLLLPLTPAASVGGPAQAAALAARHRGALRRRRRRQRAALVYWQASLRTTVTADLGLVPSGDVERCNGRGRRAAAKEKRDGGDSSE
jgi:hypothetical protein